MFRSGSALGRAEEPRALDKASRQALLTYFVFNPSEDNEEGDNSCSSERVTEAGAG